MNCHNGESNGFFNCQSYFVKEVCPITDPIPEPKKKNEVVYLPGEKLLIKLGKQKKKKDKLDVNRLIKGLKQISI